ncbi:hypothetical protein CBR_g24028 [Chara braunii]|uniref:CCHC-type domain-containing protein n=1 Tax=Chara braunii TaxID=69332 RepID=A0A388L5J8_CHABU|nr:hypothetical protein CBR_g24028 [Chara braunii]|eukprot:GBG77581.1 hypothetical protein CBR_g24028 [Chara braunii]
MFPLGFGRVCTSRMFMRSGTVKPGPTPAEQAKIDRRLAKKKKEKEAKKKQKEEEAKRKMKEKMDKELEEELKSIQEEDEEEEEEEQEERGALQRRRQLDIPESSSADRLPVEPMDWADKYYYFSEPLKESDEERDKFIAKLATVTDTVERNLLMAEKRAKLNARLLASRRQELEEKKRLQAEGEKLQKALEAQKENPSETEPQLALLKETVLNTRQDMNLMHQTLQRVEAHRVEFENVWNNFLEKAAKDVDQHVQTYIKVLDEHVTKTVTPEVIEKIVKGAGGDGGNEDDDGDDDKKGKNKIGDPKEKLPQETGQVSKIKLKLPWTYNGKKEESVLHWAAAIETYVYGQRIPYWDRVLMATSCMGGDAMSFAISLQKEEGCSSMLEYSQQTRIEDFLKLIRERFEDKNLARRTEMLILSLPDRKWKSTSALKATMDELLQWPDHGLTPAQILNSFARALLDPLRTQLYPRTKEEGMTYEKFGKIAIDHAGFLAEANYCHYWNDLQAGKRWQNRTISGSIPGKDSLLLTFEEGGAETISWDQVRAQFDLKAIHDAIESAETGTDFLKVQNELVKYRQAHDKIIMEQLAKISEQKEEKEVDVTEETVDENIRQLEEALEREKQRKQEMRRHKERNVQQEQKVGKVRHTVIHTEEEEHAISLAQLVNYLAHLEMKIERMQSQIDDVASGLRTVTNLVKGKEQVKEEKTKKREKLMGDAMKSLKVETKKTEEKPETKKGEPSSPPSSSPSSSPSSPPKSPSPKSQDKVTTQPEKPKKKEKVKMKLSFTFCNKKDENLLLWITEIQTYCRTAPVEPESQVAFSTSCLGGEAKEWVLAKANATGFDDFGEWAGTLNLKQLLGKIKERFLDKTTTDEAFDQLTTIGQRHWTSMESLSREFDHLLQVPGLNLQDNQVLYIYSHALPETIRGQLVAKSKSGKYNYRQFRDLALQREQMTSQVKNSYASVVKYGGGAGTGKRILWRQKRQDHTLVVFDDVTVENWPLEVEGVTSSSDSGKGEVTVVVVNKGGPRPPVKKKKSRSFPEHPEIAVGKPWEKMGLSQETCQERMDNAQCLKCGIAGHVIAWCPLIRNPKASRQ